jgi:hypothetical protein
MVSGFQSFSGGSGKLDWLCLEKRTKAAKPGFAASRVFGLLLLPSAPAPGCLRCFTHGTIFVTGSYLLFTD